MTDVAKKEVEVIGENGNVAENRNDTPKPEKLVEETKEKECNVEEVTDVEGEKSNAVEKTEKKSEENEAIPELERNIVHQVEYYFSDANLIRDKFLQEAIGKDAEGWVPLSVLLTFKRLATLTKDPKVVVKALFKSDEGLLEISEDREKIRRDPGKPVPAQTDERRKEIQLRTVYGKGFPTDTDISQILESFNQHKVMNITMRKYCIKPTKTKKFKGSIFVTFDTVENAKAFIAGKGIKFEGRELIWKFQEDYFKDKAIEIEEKKQKKKARKEKAQQTKIDLPKGAVLKFENTYDTLTRESLRDAVKRIETEEGQFDVAFIDYSKGQKEGYIRFRKGNTAEVLINKLENKKLKIDDESDVVITVMTEEEEKAYLEDTVKIMQNRRHSRHRKFENLKCHSNGGDNKSVKKKNKQKA